MCDAFILARIPEYREIGLRYFSIKCCKNESVKSKRAFKRHECRFYTKNTPKRLHKCGVDYQITRQHQLCVSMQIPSTVKCKYELPIIHIIKVAGCTTLKTAVVMYQNADLVKSMPYLLPQHLPRL